MEGGYDEGVLVGHSTFDVNFLVEEYFSVHIGDSLVSPSRNILLLRFRVLTFARLTDHLFDHQ